jgi:5'-nucleotidase
MSKSKRKQILLTNDDGIESPGLWAAAEALSSLGFVTVAAPRDQVSASGRSMPTFYDGRILVKQLQIGDQSWTVHAIGGTPAQVVMHALLEVMDVKPDLVVSGINYGENLGNSITVSGTVGAAMEAAAMGIPAIAASLEMINIQDYRSNPTDINFSTAANYTHRLAKWILTHGLPNGVDLVKLDVPHDATPETPWRITRLGEHRYFEPYLNRKGSWDHPAFIEGHPVDRFDLVSKDSDIYTLRHDRMISITPLQLDMTANINFADLDAAIRKKLN